MKHTTRRKVTGTNESGTTERIEDGRILLKLVSQSEEYGRNGRWISQAEMERRLLEILRVRGKDPVAFT